MNPNDNERCDNDLCTICNTQLIRLTNINDLHNIPPLHDPATRRAEREYYDD